MKLLGSKIGLFGFGSSTGAQDEPESVDRNTPSSGTVPLSGSSRRAIDANTTLGASGATESLITPGVSPGTNDDPPMSSVQVGLVARALLVRYTPLVGSPKALPTAA